MFKLFNESFFGDNRSKDRDPRVLKALASDSVINSKLREEIVDETMKEGQAKMDAVDQATGELKRAAADASAVDVAMDTVIAAVEKVEQAAQEEVPAKKESE
jgi:hypothetical protein